MIKYEHGTITYTVRKGTIHAPWIEHAATTYGFLLNTPKRRGENVSWLKFAELMKGYSSHLTTQLLALHVEQEGQHEKGVSCAD